MDQSGCGTCPGTLWSLTAAGRWGSALALEQEALRSLLVPSVTSCLGWEGERWVSGTVLPAQTPGNGFSMEAQPVASPTLPVTQLRAVWAEETELGGELNAAGRPSRGGTVPPNPVPSPLPHEASGWCLL